MSRRDLATFIGLWGLIATSVAAGILVGGLILGILSPGSASRSGLDPIPAASPPLPNDGRTTVPSPEDRARIEGPTPPNADAPDRGPGVAGGSSSSPATGNGPAPTEAAPDPTILRGIATRFRSPQGGSNMYEVLQ